MSLLYEKGYKTSLIHYFMAHVNQIESPTIDEVYEWGMSRIKNL